MVRYLMKTTPLAKSRLQFSSLIPLQNAFPLHFHLTNRETHVGTTHPLTHYPPTPPPCLLHSSHAHSGAPYPIYITQARRTHSLTFKYSPPLSPPIPKPHPLQNHLLALKPEQPPSTSTIEPPISYNRSKRSSGPKVGVCTLVNERE